MDESAHRAPPDCGGRFAIRSCLGAGGMGSVWSAYDHKRQSPVAIKIMRDPGATWLYRFKHEFRSLAGTVHPNLVTLHELIEWRDEWLFTMELVPGVHLDMRSAAPEEVATNLGDVAGDGMRFADRLRQLCDGLDFLHRLGLAHGDVKPENALVTPDGRVVILDFGIARDWRAGVDGDPHPYVGTLAYLSPERLFGQASDPASDLYAVGVMLFDALTGRELVMGMDAGRLLVDVDFDSIAGGAPRPLDRFMRDLCLRLIARDPAARPTAAEVRDALVAATGRSVGPVVARPNRGLDAVPFVARERERAVIVDALLAAGPLDPRVVIVSGESGIGKSALLRRIIDETLLPAALVLEGRCYERENVSYRALDRLVDALSAKLLDVDAVDIPTARQADLVALAQMFPVLRRVPAIARQCDAAPAADQREPRARRRAAASLLGHLMARVADGRHLVLYVDDLQWGDEESGRLLRDLIQSGVAPDLRLVGCQRKRDANSGFLAGLLAGDPPIAHLDVPLAGLSAETSELLARSLLGPDASPSHVARVATEAHGSPFLIRELVEFGAGFAPEELALRPAVARHIELLPPSARSVLEVLAVAGRRLEIDLARAASDAGETFEAAVSLLRSQHLIVASDQHGEQIEPYHDRIRTVILQGLASEGLVARHLDLVRALEQFGGADPAILGFHLEGAREFSRAVEALWQAAQLAEASLAPLNAAGHYAKIVELSNQSDPRQRAALAAQALNLSAAGHGASAAPLYLRLAEGAEPVEALRLRRHAAEAWVYAGEFERARALLGSVLEAGGVREPRTLIGALVGIARNQLWLWRRGHRYTPVAEAQILPDRLVRIDAWENAAELWSTLDLVRSFFAQTSELRESLIVGEPRRVARALVERTTMVGIRGKPASERASELLRLAAEASAMGDFPEEQALIRYATAMHAVLNGRYADVVAAGGALANRSDLNRAMRQLRTLRSIVMYSRWWLGEWRTMMTECDAWIRDAVERGDPLSECGFRLEQGSQWNHLLADEPDRIEADVARVLASPIGEELTFSHLAAKQTLAWVALYQGRGAEADRVLQIRGADRLYLRVQRTRVEIAVLHAFAALARGRSGRRDAHAWARRIAKEGLDWSAPIVQLIEASLCAQAGRRDECLVGLESAIRGSDRLGYAMFSAAASWRFGELRGGAEGEALRLAAQERIAMQGALRPDRIVGMLAPGFGGVLA